MCKGQNRSGEVVSCRGQDNVDGRYGDDSEDVGQARKQSQSLREWFCGRFRDHGMNPAHVESRQWKTEDQFCEEGVRERFIAPGN